MTTKRKVEVFSAGCATCREAIEAIKREACPSCEIIVHDMMDSQIAARAKKLGIRAVPAVVINGILASCCSGSGVDIQDLRNAGLGRAL
jgi:glutaredoxin 3